MIKLNQSAEELAARKRVAVEIRGCFACSESARKKAWKAVLALRPGRKKGKRLTLTYIDIFYDGSYQWCDFTEEQEIALMPEIVDLILRDKDFGEADWSGLVFVGNMLRSRCLYDACNPQQRSALANFIEYLMKYRVVRHGCGIFMGEFEYSLILWRDSKWSCDG
jgi:hypothetical protein